MDYSKINKYKTPIITGSFLLVFVVMVVAFFYGISQQTATSPNNIQTTIDLKIKGNRSSKIYHLKGCPNYDDIAERNIVWFKTSQEAEKAGYRIAKNC